jgi:uncharacterized protein YuzE
MRLSYDPQADAMYLRLSEDAVRESEEVRPGFVFDIDGEGRVVGIEILGVRRYARKLPLELTLDGIASTGS